MRLSWNSAATRTAFFIALEFEEPCVMMHTPFTPSNGAPPYSVWSRRFLKSVKALRDSSAPTCRVIFRVRRAMRDDAHAFHAQQWRASIFRVVQALLKIGESASR